MIDTGDLRKGLTLDIDGRLVKLIDFSHNKQGRGSAQVRMTLRDLRTGALTQQSVQAGARFTPAGLERSMCSSFIVKPITGRSWIPIRSTRSCSTQKHSGETDDSFAKMTSLTSLPTTVNPSISNCRRPCP